MKIHRCAFLFLTAISLFSCNTEKHYFKKRIAHPREAIAEKQDAPGPAQTFVWPVAENVLPEPVADADAKPLQDEPVPNEIHHKRTLPNAVITEKPSVEKVWPAEKGNARPAIVPATSGNDKEGFVLLLVLAALMVGLGLLFYFLIPAVGLVLLIIFSILAGILLVLVLLALVF